MKNILIALFILFVASMKAQNKISASDKALAAIDAIEKFEAEIKIPNRLACLTQIFPKDVDFNYVGQCYRPTKEELQLWREWIIKNKENLEYEQEEPEGKFDFIFGEFNIVFNDKKGTIRNSYCN
ncbi:hypothetical protein HYN48_14100 [Flavobacterium magnum]|uniref:Uncharacterized protein n=1 Tax=Flavobacterium magnum TaxID=2162713 RepID=A0A2S0RK83_9FLAO|nr:hypothetical protein [Flavobacterium magnum]AWA31132.1 hypothetical protein HYN48_14100 [Flavobacterium magnum]